MPLYLEYIVAMQSSISWKTGHGCNCNSYKGNLDELRFETPQEHYLKFRLTWVLNFYSLATGFNCRYEQLQGMASGTNTGITSLTDASGE
jgi:hypothetical protein